MKIIVFIFCIFYSTSLFSQKPRSFASALKEFNLEYKAPKGYVELDSSIIIIDGKTGYPIGHSNFLLKSRDGNILVGFSFQGPIDTNHRNVFKKFDGTMWDPNKNYIPFGIPFTAFSMKFTRKNYNADASGTWDLTPSKTVPVLNKDEKCRVVVFHKENKVDMEIFHYYKNITPEQLDKHLRRTKKILRFKDSK